MTTPVEVDAVAQHLELVRHRISDAGGDAGRVRVVAVTKGFGVAAVRAALECGLVDVGENYIEEMMLKATGLPEVLVGGPPRWHFLGTLQRNKIARAAAVVGCWETVSRIEEGESIARHAPGAEVMVQVNATGLPGRNGCPPEAVGGLVEGLRRIDLRVTGLMTVGEAGSKARTKAAFRDVAALADHLGLVERSMGMTEDLELAVGEGTTMVRVGRALFGPRPERTDPLGATTGSGARARPAE